MKSIHKVWTDAQGLHNVFQLAQGIHQPIYIHS